MESKPAGFFDTSGKPSPQGLAGVANDGFFAGFPKMFGEQKKLL